MWRSIFGSFSVRVLTAVLNLALVILFSQLTGASGKGEQSILLTSVAIITIFDSFIGGAALVYLSPRYSWYQLLVSAYLWILVISICAFILLSISNILSRQYIIDVIILSALSTLSSVHASLMLGHKKIKIYNLIQITVPALTFLGCLLQWHFWHRLNYPLALYISFASSLLLSCIFLILHLSKTPQIQKKSWRHIFNNMARLGFFNQLAHILQLLSFRASYYLLEEFNGIAQVGIYSNASSITESIWLIATSISLWQYTAISNSKDREYTIQITEKLSRFGLFASLIGVLVFLLLPSAFYIYIFGTEFGSLKKLMLFLAPGVWIFTYALIVGHYFSGHGKYWVNALASFCGLVLGFIASIILIPTWSATGAAIGASISYCTTSLVVLIYFQKDGGRFSLFPSKSDWMQIATQLRVLGHNS